MKITIYLKSIFLLICMLLVGSISAQTIDPEKYDHEWVKVTDLSKVESGDVVLLVDVDKKIALSSENDFMGIGVTINDDGTIADDVPQEKIKWKVTKSQNEVGQTVFSFTRTQYTGPLYGYTTGELSFETGIYTAEYESKFRFDNYGENGGNLGFMFNSFLGWENRDGKYYGRIKDSAADITLYKRAIKNYVKWKKVSLDNIVSGDTIVIVDLKTGKAMSNDKGDDKDPAAVAVTLNDELDRIIMDDVPKNVKWEISKPQYGTTYITFKTDKTEDNKVLYADTSDKVLRVGNAEGDNKNKEFIFFQNSLSITFGGVEYKCYSDDSMFSNVWKLGDSSDDKAQSAQIAIFKKVEDPQKIAKIEMAEYYNLYSDAINYADLNASITGADFSEINWASTKPGVATAETVTDEETNRTYGKVTGYQRGSTVITASVIETDYHDKASAKSTVIVDEVQSTVPGSLQNPLTVAQAKELAEKGKVTVNGTEVNLEDGVRYYIKGKVSKVNSGMMAMFGDMDFGEMMGDSGSGMNFEDSMDDMDFDPEDMEESGFDMSSMGFDMSSMGFDMSAMFGTSDKVTYYISDDGTKDGQMKVINGCGTLNSDGSTAMEFNPIPKLSPGDCVVVCGPLVYTEDTSMFSGMMGNNNSDEPKMSGKVDEMNYLAEYDPTLLITSPEPKEIYVNKTLDGRIDAKTPLYTIDELFDRFHEDKFPEGVEIQPATYKSSDEDIAKWDEETNLITGVNEGKAKITVKVKVIVVKDDPSTEDKNEEKSYTMKRKFKLVVKTRDLLPAGYYDGEWVLTTSASDLKEGTRLVLVGTRVKEDKETAEKTYTDYMMVENNAMMGGGKNGSKIEFDDTQNKESIPSSTVVSKGGLEVVLEKADENGTSWYLNVGTDENDTPLYLYASDTSEEENGEGEGEGDDEGGNKFDMKKMMEMFSPSSGLKTGTMEAATADSCKATISITDNIATISFPKTQGKNNTIMLSSSFDMEEMMGMFGGMGGKNENEGDDPEGNNEQTEEESTFDMGSFDMFMASFNTKKPGDENPTVDEETGETKAPKCFMPRIYRFVPDETFKTSIGTTEWKTIVSYKDVEVPETVEAYVVTKITKGDDGSLAHLKEIEDKKLKGGEPYLLHSTSGDYTLTLLTPNDPDELPAPKKNLLQVSTRTTSGEKGNTSVYVLADKSKGVGFYKWTGGDLGKGRVYLPVEASVEGANEFCSFFENGHLTDAIQEIDRSELNDAPCYDLQGRRVKNPTKGVYVVKGRKVIIK